MTERERLDLKLKILMNRLRAATREVVSMPEGEAEVRLSLLQDVVGTYDALLEEYKREAEAEVV